MKKFLFFSALAALLLSTAACSSDEPAAQGDDTVTFTVNLQNGNDSRAISDGTKAVNLTAFAYKDGQKVQQQTATFSGLKATVTFKLVKGVKYDFSFWAQSPDAKCYTLSADGTKVNIDYTQAASNVDNDDAFYGVKKDVTVGTSASDETVTIYRPFAQLNYGDNLDDYEAAKKAGTEVTKTLVTVEKAANVLDLTTGQASGDVAVTYALAPVPSESKELTVDGTNYKWLAMNYLLVPGQVRMADTQITTESGLVTTTLAVYAGETKLNEMSVANVPVQSNHRTNILGNLLTDKVNFNVVIDPVFDNPDYYDGTYYYVDANTSFQQVIDKINTDQPEKAVIMIKGNTEATWNHAEYGSMFGDKRSGKTIATQSVIVIGENKNKVTITGSGVWGIEPNGVAMTFKNIALYDDTRYEYENGNNAWEFAYLELGGNMKFLDCDITDGVMASGNNATFINCNFVADGNAKRKTPSDEYNPWVANGNASFTGCTFTGYRAIKVHEQYGTKVGTVIVDGCTFKNVTKKPGVVLGTLASDVVVTIKNSTFINCAEGSSSKADREPYIFESDTKRDLFHLTLEHNTVKE